MRPRSRCTKSSRARTRRGPSRAESGSPPSSVQRGLILGAHLAQIETLIAQLEDAGANFGETRAFRRRSDVARRYGQTRETWRDVGDTERRVESKEAGGVVGAVANVRVAAAEPKWGPPRSDRRGTRSYPWLCRTGRASRCRWTLETNVRMPSSRAAVLDRGDDVRRARAATRRCRARDRWCARANRRTSALRETLAQLFEGLRDADPPRAPRRFVGSFPALRGAPLAVERDSAVFGHTRRAPATDAP